MAISSADFSVTHLSEYPGWIVTCHHPAVLTYVHPSEVEDSDPLDHIVGLIGRSRRQQDSEDLEVVHVEGTRPE